MYPALLTHLLPPSLSLLLSLHALRRRSLSPGGALAAFLVGFALFTCPLRAFAVALLVFYFLGSRATRCMSLP
jgi:uncharacterized membrane protein